MIDRTLGRYRIVAKLGEGGMGSVWRAEDPALGRAVALKLLSSALWADDTARRRFLREARAASQLDHPNIATVYDVGETDGLAWIAYQFVDGETVAARTAAGPLPIAEAVTLAGETAQALAHAHARGVLHRDVTAGNVMVTREGHAMLVDFGLALPERGAHLTTTGTALGTAGYMAPEMMRGEPATARSDLYGLGAVLYRMLTGRLPFEGGPPEAVMYRVLNETVLPPSELRPDLPSSLERVVLQLLERNPADRHASAAEVVEALREVAPERGPTAMERARRTLARRYRRTSEALRRVGRKRIGVTALASIAILAAALWFAAQRGWLPGTSKEPQVIAVLPFKNTSADSEETAFLGEGLGEELVLKLGRARSIEVIPWASTRALTEQGGNLSVLAGKLHVNALLVGSFRNDGERLRVTVSLVDGHTGVQRWSQAFDELLTDFMTVQANIATGVATAVQSGLTPEEKAALAHHPTSSPQAYEFYLRGAAFLNSPDAASQALAEPFFEKAVEADSSLAEAYVGLGAIQLDRYFRGQNAGLDVIETGERYMRHALALQPGMSRALRGLLKVSYLMGRTEDCLRIGEMAANRGDNDVEGLLIRGWACMLGLIPDVGVPIFDRALQLDPSNREAAWFRMVTLSWAEQHAVALQRGKEFIRRFGEDPEIYTWMGASAICLGHEHESLVYYDRALELFGDDQSNLYSVLQVVCVKTRHGDSQGAQVLAMRWREALRARLAAVPDNDRVLGTLIFMECALGDRASARRDVRLFLKILDSPRAGHPEVAWVLLPSLARMGELDLAKQAILNLRKRDLATCQGMLRKSFSSFCTTGPCPELESLPEYQSFVRDVRARVEQVRKQYIPAISLRAKVPSLPARQASTR